MTNPLQKIWSYLQRANDYWDDKTQPLRDSSTVDTFDKLNSYFNFDTKEQTKLQKTKIEEDGEDFIDRKVDDVNRNASHRTAFVANSLAQFLLVNVSSFSLLSFVPESWFKILLVGANLFIALIAWRRIRNSRSQLLEGPSEEPNWSFWGMFRSNRRKHNQHVKDLAEPHKIRMRDERLFSIMYVINAVTLFFASQLIFSDYLPSIIGGIINFPLFIVTIPLAIANAYWAFRSNNQVVKAATERGRMLDKLKL